MNKFFVSKNNNRSKNSMQKNCLTSSATLTLSIELDKNKDLVKQEVLKIAKENVSNFLNILNYAKNNGTEYYLVKKASKLLSFIKEEPGLIFPRKGFGALFLNAFTTGNISFKTDTMFVFDPKNISAYTILYNFYKWYACRAQLPGFDIESLKKFKNIDENSIENMNYHDVISLKQVIARDREAMEFVISFMKEMEGSKKAYDAMKNKEGGASF